MARYQYRVGGEFEWLTNSGKAILVISNPAGSGKKLTIGRFELTPLSSTTGSTAAGASATQLTLARATVAGGIPKTPTPHDSDASSWPSSARIVTRATVSSPSVIRRVNVLKQLLPTSTGWGARMRPANARAFRGGVHRSPWATATTVEGLVVRAGEAIALYSSTLNNSVPLRVSVTLSRAGSPKRTWSTAFFTSVLGFEEAVFAFVNDAGSGETFTILDLNIEEVGTFDSPYFQLAPIGSVDAVDLADAVKAVSPAPMDTNYPSPSTWLKCYSDVVVYPLGMPEDAFSGGSTGSPKGFNYFKTKDFLGPVFRAVFPEQVRVGLTLNDYMGYGTSHKAADLLLRRAGVVLREGESIGLVSAAETAAGATSAVGVSGWSSWHIAAQVTVEPATTPTLTLTGLKNPTEVRVFDGGTTTEVAGQETITTGSFSWQYDPDTYSEVDIAILTLGYQNIRLTGIALGTSDVTIPVQQQIDRQYNNP